MKRLIFILCIFATACNTTKQAQRKLQKIEQKHPELFDADTVLIARTDTVQIITIQIEHDTIIDDADTIVVETEQFKTEIIRMPFETVRVKTLIKSDTIEVIEHDTIWTIQKEIVTKTDVKTITPFWLYIVIVLLILYLIYITFFRRI